MTNVTFTYQKLILYRPVLDHVLNDPEGDVGSYMKRRGRFIVLAAKKQVGVDTGLLRASIKMLHYRGISGQYLWIGSNDSIALLHHNGSRPHTIVPRTASHLRFSSGGRIIYTKLVHHPGTRPNRYLSDNLVLFNA
jgi:hypothetical protein